MEATAKPPRMARGLNALLGDVSAPNDGPVSKLQIEKIAFNPYQPRKQFDGEELAALATSIKNHGVLQPLVVRSVADGYQLIAGERRLRAAKEAGLAEVPVHVVAFDDQQVFEAALVENIQRSDLNPIEKAQGFKDYLEKFAIKQDQLGARLGLSASTVSNLLGLLHLHKDVQEAVRSGQLSLSHAKVLRSLPTLELQASFAKDAILKNYSVQALEMLVKQHRVAGATPEPETPVKREPAEKTAHVKGLEDDLRQRLAVKIEIRVKAKDKGQIVIGFDSNDDFERIVQALQK